jgi:hypothetical protein
VSAPPLTVPTGLFWFTPRAEPGSRELRDAEDRVIGTLRFLPKPAVTWGFTDRQSARGEVGPLNWDLSIARSGLSGALGASATALIDGGKSGTITCGPFFATGVLALASGRRLVWKGSVLVGMPCAFADDGGTALVRINSGSFSTRVNGTVDVEPQAADVSEWPLLVVLALYLRLLMNRVWH